MNVSVGTASRLQLLGARVRQIEEAIPYPFPATPNRVAINKPCRWEAAWLSSAYNECECSHGGTASRLQLLGARVKEAIPYPFPAAPNRVAINKPCRWEAAWLSSAYNECECSHGGTASWLQLLGARVKEAIPYPFPAAPKSRHQQTVQVGGCMAF
ncbi:hypothetical protein CLOP_g24230 [Closterium sp. NIES-67]|nr:hypothetical protein CLOP_g24230 [Closterium sp. NIES-67]